MSSTLDRIFGVRSLSGAAVEIYKQLPHDSHLQDVFKQGDNLSPEGGGRVVEYDKVLMPKEAAPITSAGGEFVAVENLQTKNETIRAVDIKLCKLIEAHKLYSDRNAGELRDNAPAVIRREQRGLAKQINTTRELLAAQTLKGSVSIGPSQIPSMEAGKAISYSFGDVNSFTVSASWATAGTKIFSTDVPALKTDYFQTARIPLGTVLVDGKIPGYLAANTELQGWLQSGDRLAEKILMGRDISGPAMDGFQLGGLDWQVNENGYDVSGAFTKFLGDNVLVGLPRMEYMEDVLGWAECKGEIPRTAIASGAGAEQAVVQAPSAGIYSFAAVNTNPVGIMLFMGWSGTFVLKHEGGVIVESNVTTA